MFDAAYFRERLPQDVREKQRASREHEPSVKIHLHGGATYTLARSVEIGSGWAVFDVYTKKHRAPAELLDRMTFAYNAISHVTITLKPIRGLGFQHSGATEQDG